MTETNISIARVPQVTVIDPRIPEKAKLRVAAYARVSSDSEDQVNSYIAQVDFYTKHIAGKEDWEMVDIYADEGISGLEARNRDDFNRMMADCREGKIDRVLCKSISRFARNTQEYIQFVRELLRLGISIHFEKENIDTGKMTSEQVAQIYGAFAQMESTNHSSNMRFSVRMRMEKGLFVPSSVPYGYRLAGRDLEIIPEEAEVVRRIFSAYLSGQGKDDIARELNQLGVDRGRNREKWHPSTVAYILTNISYTGDMIWQKSCATDTIPFRQVRNLGQKPRYFVEHSHPAIVSCADFQRVQELMSSRKGQFHGTHRISKGSRYDKHIYCGGCGSLCRKKITGGKTYWVCRRHDGNKADCPSVVQKMLCNEKYIGDALLQKTYIADLFTREKRVNNGELPKYYVHDCHPAIIDRETFQKVQEEIARRSSLKKTSSKAKTQLGKYCGKYVLSELLVCGECGSPYRRVIWTQKGVKRVVWRCQNRLEHGRKICKQSPTLDEGDIHDAVISAMNELFRMQAAKDAVKAGIAAVLAGEEQTMSLPAVELQIRNLQERQLELFQLIVSAGADCTDYDEELQQVNIAKTRLMAQKAELEKEQRGAAAFESRLAELDMALEQASGTLTDFDELTVRQLVSNIKVLDKDSLLICFKDGTEITQAMQRRQTA